MAHAITALRVLLTIPLVLAVSGATPWPGGWVAAPTYALIAASDVIDGMVARAAGTASGWGRAFDHGADIFFVLSVFTAYVWVGVVAWWVPASIAVAFALYAATSRTATSPTAARRVAGRIGHLGGVCNYVIIGVLIGNETVGLRLLPPELIQAVLAAVPLYSAAAVFVRWWPTATSRAQASG